MHKPTEQHNTSNQNGLVISYFGNSVAVETENGQVFQCHLRRNQELPVVGDQVLWELGTGEMGVILSIGPRRSLFSRSDGHGKIKSIAANIDAIVIVMSPPPIFSEYLVDRYLVAAELLQIHPVLVLNKMDLLIDSTRAAVLSRLWAYRQIPYPVVLSSTIAQDGLHDLGLQLKDKAAVLVGPSGVGKSSIIAGLCHGEAIRVGEVSPQGAGKHTTTATRLYHLRQGGSLIDSPGVREFNLWPVSQKEALRGFKEFQCFLQDCKFRDCLHLVEPGCAVQSAVASGKISPQRFTNYKALMNEARSRNHKY
jgi:ribosome biogenesis GTPase